MAYIVDGKFRNVDVGGEEGQEVLRGWKEKDSTVYCACKGKTVTPDTPQMKVAHYPGRHTEYVFRSNRDSKEKHDALCKHGQIYETQMRIYGVSEINDGIVVNLDITGRFQTVDVSSNFNGDPSERSNPPSGSNSGTTRYKAKLTTLLKTLLIESGFNQYRPMGSRTFVGRMLHYLEGMFVRTHGQVEPLIDIAWLAGGGRKMRFSKDKLVIGWGNLDTHPVTENADRNFLVDIPILSVQSHEDIELVMRVSKQVYDKRPSLSTNSCPTGYWLIWKEPKEKDGKTYLNPVLVAFLPAEEVSMIPVDSNYEAILLNRLVKERIVFEKPLLGDYLDLDLRPDMVLPEITDTPLYIEVTGMVGNPDYDERLKKKRITYRMENMHWIEWEPKSESLDAFVSRLKRFSV